MPSRDCLLAYASELAYLIVPRTGTAPPVPHIPADAPHYADVVAGEPTCFVGGEEKIDAAFVAEMPDGHVVVSFRGTIPPFDGPFWRWVDDWIEDFDVDPVPWVVGDPDDPTPYGRVEHGFDRAVLALWYQIPGHGPLAGRRPGLHGALTGGGIDWSTKKGILVTGHSKGAAATYLAASLIRAEPALRHVPVEVVCFASPYVCDAEFRRCYDDAGLLAQTTRYQNVDDLVPFVPNVLVAAPLALARRLHPKASGGAGPWWTWAYVSMGRLRVVTRSLSVVDGAPGRFLAFWRIVIDLLTFQLGRVASAHSLVYNPKSTHPTGRYTCGACTPGQPCPPTAEAEPAAVAAEATAAP